MAQSEQRRGDYGHLQLSDYELSALYPQAAAQQAAPSVNPTGSAIPAQQEAGHLLHGHLLHGERDTETGDRFIRACDAPDAR